VIQDVDDTLKELLVKRMPIDPIDSIDVKFDMPNKEWSATVTKPTINLFLYDVRENHELRSNDRTVVRSTANPPTTGVVSRAPVRMDLSYLISVWTTDISDEHQVLARVLATLLQFPLLPNDVLKGSLQSQPFPVHAWIAQPERLPNPWEFWGHMDHGMKASLNFVLTTSWQPILDETVKLVLRSKINLPTAIPNPTKQTT
jgi:Pvc16 N-terminal domain